MFSIGELPPKPNPIPNILKNCKKIINNRYMRKLSNNKIIKNKIENKKYQTKVSNKNFTWKNGEEK